MKNRPPLIRKLNEAIAELIYSEMVDLYRKDTSYELEETGKYFNN